MKHSKHYRPVCRSDCIAFLGGGESEGEGKVEGGGLLFVTNV